MKSSALFAVMVLGTAATVSAQPKREAPPKHDEAGGRVRLNESTDQNPDAGRAPSDWVELASPTPAKHGTEFVMIGKEAGAFSKLRFDAAKGKTIVRKVKVFFDDGKVKTIDVDTIVSD